MGFDPISATIMALGTIGGAASAVGAAIAPIGSLFSAITVASSLFGSKPKVPKPRVPAQPAAAPRTSGGADVQLGTDDRISGSFRDTKRKTKSTDVLSGLGRGGLAL